MRTSVFHTNILIPILFLPLIFLGGGCGQFEKHSNGTPSPEYACEIDSLDLFIWNNFDLDADSMEKLLTLKTQNQTDLRKSQKLMNIYLQLIEFYQYRKPDSYKAVVYLGQATKIIAEQPEYFMDNPYLFIDIGNVFLQIKLYNQAAIYYKIAENIANKTAINHAKALALQNLGITFQRRQLPDSALSYFNEVDQMLTAKELTMRAQNNNLIAGILIHEGKFAESMPLLQQNFILLADDKKQFPENYKIQGNRYHVYWEELMAKTHKNLCCYYYFNHEPDSSLAHLNKALYFAQKSHSMRLLAELLVVKTTHYAKGISPKQLEQLADSAYEVVSKINDLEIQKTFSDSLSALFRRTDQKNYEQKYLSLSEKLGDSLLKIKGNKEFIESVLQMSTLATEEAVHNLEDQHKAKTATIVLQRRIIQLTITIAIVILLALLVIQLQKIRLNKAYLAVVKQIQQNHPNPIPKETTEEKKKNGDEMAEKLEIQLRELMQKEKTYLQKDISLHHLATQLNTNRTYLSTHINHFHQKSFSDYINKLRIDEACRLLMYSNPQNFTIDGIADMCGFNSKSAFYGAFKKETGMSPSTFQKIHGSSL